MTNAALVRLAKAVPKDSLKRSTPIRCGVEHEFAAVALPAEELSGERRVAVRLWLTKATVGVGFERASDVAPEIEIDASRFVLALPPLPDSEVALALMFTKRYTRDGPLPGGSTGMPKNVTEFPETFPGKIFGRP